jgi:hypothetical protein
MGWTTKVRFPVGARDLSFLHSVETGSGAYPGFYPMGIGGSFARGKAVGA